MVRVAEEGKAGDLMTRKRDELWTLSGVKRLFRAEYEVINLSNVEDLPFYSSVNKGYMAALHFVQFLCPSFAQ